MALAAEVGVPCSVVPVAVGDGPNLEARARAARRAALPADALTGHTADDRAATLLVNLLRGAGADGLAAMGPAPTRPILDLRRAETLALCATHGLRPVVDPSNADPRFVRNRVRDELLPLLDDIAGRDVVPLLVRTAGLLADDAAARPGPGRRGRRHRRPGPRRHGTGDRPSGRAPLADRDRRRRQWVRAGPGHRRAGPARGHRRAPGV